MDDDVPVDFFAVYDVSENGIEKLMTYWDQISAMNPLYLQVHIRSMGWMPLLGVFVDRWGIDSATADILRCCRVVRDELPVYLAQLEERYNDVMGIRDYREWIESPNPPFPRDLFYQNLWIPRVEAFVRRWTDDYVPDDIKRSLAEATERYPID